MRFASLLTACLLWATVAWSLAFADDPPKKLTPEERKELQSNWDQLLATGAKQYQAGKLSEAVDAFEKALATARRLYPKEEFPDGHLDLALSLKNLALIRERQGKHTEAVSLYRDAIEVYKRVGKGDHPYAVGAFNDLANLFLARSQFAEAEAVYRDALDMSKRLVKGDSSRTATSLNNLGFVLKERGKYAEAEPLYREALEMRQRLFKGDHQDVANCLNNLADLFAAQAKYADAETLQRDSLEMQRRLFKGDHIATATSLNNLGEQLRLQGKYAEAEKLHGESLEMRKRLFKGDHLHIASSFNNLGLVFLNQGRNSDAEPLFRETLDMLRRLFKGDHQYLAASVGNLAGILYARGKLVEAEELEREALEMRRRLFKGDHPSVASSLSGVARVLLARGRYADAEPLYREALEMQKRLFKGDHPNIATNINSLAVIKKIRGEFAEAETLYREVLEMRKRLFKGDHPDIAINLLNLANVREAQKDLGEAERLLRDALKMSKRLFPAQDHPSLAETLSRLSRVLTDQLNLDEAHQTALAGLEMQQRLFKGDTTSTAIELNNLGYLQGLRGQREDAERLFRESASMYRRLMEEFAGRAAEGDALTLLASSKFADCMSNYVMWARSLKTDPAKTYEEVLLAKGMFARVYAHRAFAARAASINTDAAAVITELTALRARRAELILAPVPADPATRDNRNGILQKQTDRIAELSKNLHKLLPTMQRAEQLARATPADLQKALPADAVFVDLFAYKNVHKTGGGGSYAAFVVTPTAVKRVDLDRIEEIEKAVNQWRESITTPPFQIPADVPAKVRELVWAKVRKEFPAGTKVVYISPDLALTRVPWSALPGDEPGKIVLEEFAVAVVPHGLFLLDQLQPQEPAKKTPGGLLAVGGIPYDTNPAPPSLFASLTRGSRTRGELPIKAGEKLQWSELKYTKGEAEMAARIAQRKKITAELLTGADASTERVLSELPHARFAHFATHGFFADASFRSVLQVDPKLFEISTRGERVGAGALSPMTMCGLVFSGANKAETRGRGLITGDHLIDRDLSGLELAVLSACETGLGDVAGGEGVFGLQRAFHVAGCRNVVASLWKVDDAATAALMNEFYTQLWTENQPPVIALQKAQLAIYRADPKDFGKIATRGIEEGTIDLSNVPVKKYPANPTKGNHPALWAAFTLSGVGR